MKKKPIIIGSIVLVLLLIVGLTVVLWPRIPRGEHETDRGKIYYFSDGVVAIDTSRTPHEVTIYANHPSDRPVKKAKIIDDGIQVTGPGTSPGAEEFMGGELSMGYSRPFEPGKVRLFENHGEWSEGKSVVVNKSIFRDLIARKDWDASVRELWEQK